MKKITKITIVVLTVFVIGMTMGMAFADPVSATKYKGKKSLTVNVKDGKKNIKIKCKYKSGAYEGKKGKYYVTVWKGPSKSPNYKGWNTQAKNTKNWKVGSKLGKNKPVTSIRIG